MKTPTKIFYIWISIVVMISFKLPEIQRSVIPGMILCLKTSLKSRQIKTTKNSNNSMINRMMQLLTTWTSTIISNLPSWVRRRKKMLLSHCSSPPRIGSRSTFRPTRWRKSLKMPKQAILIRTVSQPGVSSILRHAYSRLVRIWRQPV